MVALNPGLVYATTIDTSEPVAAGLLAVVLLLWLRGRRVAALPLIAALCFMKEWFVLVPVGLALWELVQMLRRRRRDGWRRVAALVLSIVPFGLWYLYVLLRFGEWPASPTRDFLQLPPTGWIQTARTAAEMGLDSFDRLVTGHVDRSTARDAGGRVPDRNRARVSAPHPDRPRLPDVHADRLRDEHVGPALREGRDPGGGNPALAPPGSARRPSDRGSAGFVAPPEPGADDSPAVPG